MKKGTRYAQVHAGGGEFQVQVHGEKVIVFKHRQVAVARGYARQREFLRSIQQKRSECVEHWVLHACCYPTENASGAPGPVVLTLEHSRLVLKAMNTE